MCERERESEVMEREGVGEPLLPWLHFAAREREREREDISCSNKGACMLAKLSIFNLCK